MGARKDRIHDALERHGVLQYVYSPGDRGTRWVVSFKAGGVDPSQGLTCDRVLSTRGAEDLAADLDAGREIPYPPQYRAR